MTTPPPCEKSTNGTKAEAYCLTHCQTVVRCELAKVREELAAAEAEVKRLQLFKVNEAANYAGIMFSLEKERDEAVRLLVKVTSYKRVVKLLPRWLSTHDMADLRALLAALKEGKP